MPNNTPTLRTTIADELRSAQSDVEQARADSDKDGERHAAGRRSVFHCALRYLDNGSTPAASLERIDQLAATRAARKPNPYNRGFAAAARHLHSVLV